MRRRLVVGRSDAGLGFSADSSATFLFFSSGVSAAAAGETVASFSVFSGAGRASELGGMSAILGCGVPLPSGCVGSGGSVGSGKGMRVEGE